MACLSLASAVACISGENVGWLDIGVANADCPDMVVWLITQGVGVGVATPLTFVLFPQAITATTSTIHSMRRMQPGFMTSASQSWVELYSTDTTGRKMTSDQADGDRVCLFVSSEKTVARNDP